MSTVETKVAICDSRGNWSLHGLNEEQRHIHAHYLDAVKSGFTGFAAALAAILRASLAKGGAR